MSEEKNLKRYLPLLLSLLVVVLDQVTKIWIASTLKEGTIGYRFFGDFLWIIHVRNNAVAFSMGESMPVMLKYIFFVGFPILLMVGLGWVVVSSRTDKEFTYFQKWCLAGILGGGIGNLVDRLFRSLRVVDWISVKFYGLFGMERFPTWNLGDSAVVIGVSLLLITFILEDVKERKNKNGKR
ncbi:MAG: signal peptidase II [Spirochaetales bacterium]|nr:signal peptidase II [Candidatus Physcosoma equi]